MGDLISVGEGGEGVGGVGGRVSLQAVRSDTRQ